MTTLPTSLDEYPLEMRTAKGQTVTVLGPPDETRAVPILWPTGRYSVSSPGIHGLHPIPDPVEQYEQVLSVLRASAAPVPEGVPEDHRVCSHGIYHHGCPSCDRQDPEEL